MTFASTVAALSPTAWYRLGETAGSTTFADSSGSSHDGTVSAGVTFGATGGVTGDSNTAATFVTNSNAQVAYGSWMDAPTALSGFIIGKTSVATGIAMLMSRDDSGTARVWQLRLNAGKFEFVKIAGGVVTASSPLATYADGAFHDFGFTYDGSSIRLYVDGAKVATTAAAGSLGTGIASRLFLGLLTSGSGASNFWNGVLDEAIYKAGTVWTDSDFTALHAARIAGGGTDGSVTAVAAAATGAAVAPAVSGVRNPTVAAVAAVATAAMLVPAVSGVQNPTIEPPSATATAAAVAPTVAGTQNATVAPPTAAGTAAALAPTVFTGDVAVIAVTATATATFRVPAVTGGSTLESAPADRTYTVRPASRMFTVEAASRTYTARPASRTFTVRVASRTYTVRPASRRFDA